MKKKNICLSLLFVIAIFMMTGCGNNKKIIDDSNSVDQTTTTINESEYDNMEKITTINITINNQNYKAIIEDNETAQAFAKLLPQEFNMNELNGNEKYIYMDNTLPTKPSNPKHILAGDIMLYGNNCIVIFYESFDTSNRYTKIGHIDNLDDLGNGNIIVKFEK